MKPRPAGASCDLRILYVEDDLDTLQVVGDYIRKRWSPESQGIRSLEAAMRLLREDGYRADLVIHDCSPLYREGDEIDSEAAGDALYALCVEEGLPVVVVSGQLREEKEQKLPYRSTPPIAWLSKPLTWESSQDGEEGRWVEIDEAVASYVRWAEERS
jgi:hypothetical protein